MGTKSLKDNYEFNDNFDTDRILAMTKNMRSKEELEEDKKKMFKRLKEIQNKSKD